MWAPYYLSVSNLLIHYIIIISTPATEEDDWTGPELNVAKVEQPIFKTSTHSSSSSSCTFPWLQTATLVNCYSNNRGIILQCQSGPVQFAIQHCAGGDHEGMQCKSYWTRKLIPPAPTIHSSRQQQQQKQQLIHAFNSPQFVLHLLKSADWIGMDWSCVERVVWWWGFMNETAPTQLPSNIPTSILGILFILWHASDLRCVLFKFHSSSSTSTSTAPSWSSNPSIRPFTRALHLVNKISTPPPWTLPWTALLLLIYKQQQTASLRL